VKILQIHVPDGFSMLALVLISDEASGTSETRVAVEIPQALPVAFVALAAALRDSPEADADQRRAAERAYVRLAGEDDVPTEFLLVLAAPEEPGAR
jgi:hypothetical protein